MFQPHTALSLPRLGRDQRGAIAVIAIGMGVVLVGAILWVVDVGQALILRERLQDAADAGAFESAVWHARGMNAIAVLNMQMAVIQAAYSAAGSSPSLAPMVVAALQNLQAMQVQVASEMPVFASATANQSPSRLRDVGDPVARAQVISLGLFPVSVDQPSGAIRLPGSSGAFYLPSLPVELGEAEEICDKASEITGEEAGSLAEAKAFALSHHGEPYVYGGAGPVGWDCSGFMAGIWAVLNGKNPNQRYFSTEDDFEKFGFVPGIGGPEDFTIGVHRGGGGPNSHMAGTLGDLPVEAAGMPKGVQAGGSANSATHPSFELHWYLSLCLAEAHDIRPARVYTHAENGNAFMHTWAVVEGEAFTETARTSAEAEFYFDCEGPWNPPDSATTDPSKPPPPSCKTDAMWRPGWTARMRRFRTPRSELAHVRSPWGGSLQSHLEGALSNVARPSTSASSDNTSLGRLVSDQASELYRKTFESHEPILGRTSTDVNIAWLFADDPGEAKRIH